ncbi:helix-turn-helix transcriptional regulator [Mongoliitalea daihaiensis]|uniref:helix-turn-helix transcriptional regulator n=1 Tax=Mongoliitalea daihaiensis TaxID=2782006 RepID=UPI001F3102D9|nr:helix-turn-helix transcriptional regulator [Mongoliitalea daihaiensis]UJP64034.1 helix-turn-helix domain-containing protein [Mongoliitalea daihaiensis]
MRNKDLRALREQHKLSQKEFAEKIGISQPAISAAESKPEQLVTNRVYELAAKSFDLSQFSEPTTDDPMNVEVTISIRPSDVEKLKGRTAKIELNKLFTFL